LPRDDALLLDKRWLPEGVSRYQDSHPGLREAQPRIYVKIQPGGLHASFWTLLDTGGHFCLLNETVAGLLGDHLVEDLGTFAVRTAHGLVEGKLYRHPVALVAESGESLNIDSTVFVPPDWQGPCILGYAGVLERVRFAVDPGTNEFCFGSLSAPRS